MRTLCIYHGNCADGFGAAWVVKRYYGDDVDFLPGVYQNLPPDVTDRAVLLVDFSYKRDVIIKMLETAKRVTIIDHHASAAKDLFGLEAPNLEMNFDMTHSGAMLAWHYFFRDKHPPQLLRHIEDRDLWQFKLTHTREIQAALFSYPYDFEVWDKLFLTSTEDLAIDGRAIERKHHKDIAELVDVSMHWRNIGGYRVPCANLPYTLSSDAGHLMAERYKSAFAACYMDQPRGRVFSLRSIKGVGVNVYEVALKYGGGGHPDASGFRVDYGHPLAGAPDIFHIAEDPEEVL